MERSNQQQGADRSRQLSIRKVAWEHEVVAICTERLLVGALIS